MTEKTRLLFLFFAVICLIGCSDANSVDTTISDQPSQNNYADQVVVTNETENAVILDLVSNDTDGYAKDEEQESKEVMQEEPVEEPEEIVLDFVDVFGEHYETKVREDVTKHDYNNDLFIHDGHKLSYEDEKYTSRIGIDVSRHQGKINWEEVKNAGIEFAFIRIGYRSYGESGEVKLDQRFYENIQAAQNAGIDVGVYFFSQAINEEEALEEAKFVLDKLDGYTLQLPIVFDPENILDHVARTDDVSGEQFTRNTIVFCETIEEYGYEAMIYSNMLWEAFQFDLEKLADYRIWYADYEEKPQTPYHFSFWQYTNEGRVGGIDGHVDYDIELMEK